MLELGLYDFNSSFDSTTSPTVIFYKTGTQKNIIGIEAWIQDRQGARLGP